MVNNLDMQRPQVLNFGHSVSQSQVRENSFTLYVPGKGCLCHTF